MRMRTLPFLHGHALPQIVEEVFEEHDLVLLLGRFRGFYGSHRGYALAVRSQIPLRPAADLRDPYPGFLRHERVAVHGVTCGHDLVAQPVVPTRNSIGAL